LPSHSLVLTPVTTEESWMQFLRGVQRSRQIPAKLLAVTDGEAAYPDMPDLGRIRKIEQTRAVEPILNRGLKLLVFNPCTLYARPAVGHSVRWAWNACSLRKLDPCL